jgi:hypothetical protein
MRDLGLALAGCIAAGVWLTPASADAQEPDEKGRRGFELMLRPGYGSAGSKSPVRYRRAPIYDLFAAPDPDMGKIFRQESEPYGGGFVGEVSAGYRFLPLASAGLYGQMRSSSADGPDDSTEDLSRSAWGAGFYGRFYLAMLHESLDPYVQIGIGYAQDTQQFKRTVMSTVGPLSADWEIKHHGVVLPLGIGIGYRVIPMLSIGPSFRYDVVLAAGGCLKASASLGGISDSNSFCTDKEDDQRITEAEGYGVWSVGLDLKLTL